MLDKMKALWDMQRKMQELKRQLDDIVFEVESADKRVKITMNGSLEVKGVKINGSILESDRQEFEAAVKDAFNKALKRSQDIAAEKMKNATGLNLPGLS